MGLGKKILLVGGLLTGLWIYSGLRPEKEVRILYERARFEKPVQKVREGYVSAKDIQFERYLTPKGEVIEIRDLRTGRNYALVDDDGELTITGLGKEIVRKVDGLADRLFGENKEDVNSLTQKVRAVKQTTTQDTSSNYMNWLRR